MSTSMNIIMSSSIGTSIVADEQLHHGALLTSAALPPLLLTCPPVSPPASSPLRVDYTLEVLKNGAVVEVRSGMRLGGKSGG